MIVQPPYHFVVGCREGAYRSRISKREIENLYHAFYNGIGPGLSTKVVRFGNTVTGRVSEFLGMSERFSYAQLQPTTVIVVMEPWMQERVKREASNYLELQANLDERLICLDVRRIRNPSDFFRASGEIRTKIGGRLSFQPKHLEIKH